MIDDALKLDDALSESQRTSVNRWYDNTLLSRLNNKERWRLRSSTHCCITAMSLPSVATATGYAKNVGPAC